MVDMFPGYFEMFKNICVSLGKSTWRKPHDLKYINLKDPTTGVTRQPKMKDEVAMNTDLNYNPLPPTSTYNQNIPLHNPAKDFYLFTNTPASQSDNRKIPNTLPLPPNPPPHLVQRGNRRVDVVDELKEIPRLVTTYLTQCNIILAGPLVCP
jgi:hypothetical protein